MTARHVPGMLQWIGAGLLCWFVGWCAWEQPVITLQLLGVAFWMSFVMIVIWRFVFVLAGGFLRLFPVRHVAPLPLEAKAYPVYSVLIALRHEAHMMDQLATSLRALDWPVGKLEILLLVEADDDATREAALRAGFPAGTQVLTVPPGRPLTKPRALNFGLSRASGLFLTIYDAEDRPHPGQLQAAFAAFRTVPPDVICLQAPLKATNGAASWIAAQWALEYEVHFNLNLPALAAWDQPIMLGGTSNHFRREDLIAFGGWDAWNVTEDADLGLRAARLGARTRTIDPPTLETAPESFPVWFNQRRRWIKGYMQTWLVCMRTPIRLARQLHFTSWVSLQMTLGASILSALLYGPMTLWIFACFLLPGLEADPLSVALFALGWLVSVTADLMAPGRWRFARCVAVLTRPFYWPLQTLAALAAAYGLVVRPHFWAKTPHQPE